MNLQELADNQWAHLKGKRVTARDPQNNLAAGEYTGFSTITGKHYVSFYNGYTKAFKNLSDIEFTKITVKHYEN